MRVLGRCRRAPGQPGERQGEEGFTIVETMVALGVIFAVLTGLLASLNTGVRGLLTGRQRTGAVAMAKEVVETARAAGYDDLGHDLAGDATLAPDPRITGTAPDYEYQPEGVSTPEPLVGAVDPTYPVHEWDDPRDGTTYTVRVYVTRVTASVGNDHKRLTVAVSWDRAQYDAGTVSNEVVVSTFVSPFGVVSASRVSGLVDVDSGAVTVTGTLSGVDLSTATMFFPLVHADVAGNLVSEAHGYAGSSRSELVLASGTPTGCDVNGSTASCDGVKAETVADNDGGTAPPLQDAEGPLSSAGGTTSAGTPLSLSLGATGSVISKSSAQSCTSCTPSVGDGDGLLYADDTASGPATMDAGFDSGLVEGSLAGVDSAGSSTATVDADAVAGDRKVASTGRLVVDAVDLVTLSPAPSGYTSAVSIGAVDVTATAQAGPTAGTPSVSGSAVSVQVYDTGANGEPGYRMFTVTPGEESEEEAGVTFEVGGGADPVAQVTLETTVRSGEASTDSTSSGGVVTDAEADLSNWFVVTVRLLVVEAGVTVADLTVELDYGRIVARAGYTPV